MMGHTPTPWSSGHEISSKARQIFDRHGHQLAMIDTHENAAYIVKCVNAHDILINALKLSTNVLEALHAAEPRDDARKMLGELIMVNRKLTKEN